MSETHFKMAARSALTKNGFKETSKGLFAKDHNGTTHTAFLDKADGSSQHFIRLTGGKTHSIANRSPSVTGTVAQRDHLSNAIKGHLLAANHEIKECVTTEVEDIQELSTGTLRAYKKKAIAQLDKEIKAGRGGSKLAAKRYAGSGRALDKITKPFAEKGSTNTVKSRGAFATSAAKQFKKHGLEKTGEDGSVHTYTKKAGDVTHTIKHDTENHTISMSASDGRRSTSHVHTAGSLAQKEKSIGHFQRLHNTLIGDSLKRHFARKPVNLKD